MSIELVASDGSHHPIPRGWVILTLTLASWGVVAMLWVVVTGLLSLIG